MFKRLLARRRAGMKGAPRQGHGPGGCEGRGHGVLQKRMHGRMHGGMQKRMHGRLRGGMLQRMQGRLRGGMQKRMQGRMHGRMKNPGMGGHPGLEKLRLFLASDRGGDLKKRLAKAKGKKLEALKRFFQKRRKAGHGRDGR
jgi:hypothetical protein